MKQLLFRLTFSCRDATMVMEQKHCTGISRKTAFKLWVHNVACVYCRYYERQSILLDRLLARFAKGSDATIDNTENLKASIIRRLKTQ